MPMPTSMCAQNFQPFPLQSHILRLSNHKLHSSTILWLPRGPALALQPPFPNLICKCVPETRAISSIELPPNALRRKLEPHWRGGFTLGVDLGTSRTGLALSKGFSTRPLTVLELRGQKLEVKLIEIAEQEEADEFIIGLPKSCDGKETPQSNKIRSIAGRVAARAAERGWRVYLHDEHGTTAEAESHMIYRVRASLRAPRLFSRNNRLTLLHLVAKETRRILNPRGLNKSSRQKKIDAYAAMMVLERYFSTSGQATELVLPKSLVLQEKLIEGPSTDPDFKD